MPPKNNVIAPGVFAGYHFRNADLMAEALTHPSVNAGLPKVSRTDYERLEFLGDSVLGLAVAELLLELFPDDSESELARRHAVLVSGATLAGMASSDELGDHIVMSAGEESSGGRANKRNLANVFEALLGAVHTDGGYAAARTIIRTRWTDAARALTAAPKDAKTALQEYSQANGYGLPVYVTRHDGGSAHHPSFTSDVTIGDKRASASASNKKTAEHDAAGRWLATYQQQDN